jgi:glycerophosphoryl diester phosphodiesterase
MQLIGHRGARGEAPENTLGGFAYLAQLGLRAVEFDVRQLNDGTLVLLHDADLLRTAGQATSVYDLSHADLISIDQRQGWPDWRGAEPIVTLAQVLAQLDGFSHIEVEVKAVDSELQAGRLVESLLPVLQAWPSASITSFDLQILRAVQQQAAQAKRGLLVEIPLTTHGIIEIAQQLGCQRVGIKDSLCSFDMIEALHAAQLACSVWTVNDLNRARQLQDWGADGVITDVPSQMLAAHIGQI